LYSKKEMKFVTQTRIVFGNRRLVLAKLKQLVQADSIVNHVFGIIACLISEELT